MAYWKGEEIIVFFQDGEAQRATVLKCERGHRGWKLLCRPKSPGAEPSMTVWDSDGSARPASDPVVGIRRTGIVRPVGAAA